MKFLAHFFIIIFSCSIFCQYTMAMASYIDVSNNYKYASAIQTLSSQGIIRGFPDHSFRPDQIINRAEAVKILVQAQFTENQISQSLNVHKAKNHWYVNLLDVDINSWFAPYAEIAFKHGIAKGYQDNTFRPNQPINFAEGLKMILTAHGVNIFYPSKQFSPLLFISQEDWFASYFSYASEKGLLNNKKFYHPSQFMTRGEFVEILYRLSQIKTYNLSHFKDNILSTSDEYTITIPKLNIINQHVEFADPYDAGGALSILKRVPLGHYLAEPGKGRKFVLYGHSSGYSWDKSPFKVVLRQINKLQEGDRIYINYKEVGHIYEIHGTEIIPESQDATIIRNPEEDEIVLYTCWPPDSTKYRYLVYGRPL